MSSKFLTIMNPPSKFSYTMGTSHQGSPGTTAAGQSTPQQAASRWAKAGVLLVAALALLSAACQSPHSSIPGNLAGRAPTTLAVGDVLKFTYPGAQEYNHVQKVRTDGKVSLPLIGQIRAAGKDVGEFQEELVSRYGSKLQNKEVIVSVEQSAIPVYVSGAVVRPGRVTLDRSMTVLEAVMEANGFTPRANPGKVVLIRQGKGEHFTKTMNLSSALKGEQTEAFYLKPYDVIYVPESFF